jgi:hypothetical protein
MHVGNVTDGAADYNLAGGGQIEPDEDVRFTLQPDTQNFWSNIGTRTVIFTVGQAEVARVQGVTDSGIAILCYCDGEYHGVKLREEPPQETSPQ